MMTKQSEFEDYIMIYHKIECLDFVVRVNYNTFSFPEFRIEDRTILSPYILQLDTVLGENTEYIYEFIITPSGLLYFKNLANDDGDAQLIPFEKFFEACSEDLKLKLVFHMDIFIGSKYKQGNY